MEDVSYQLGAAGWPRPGSHEGEVFGSLEDAIEVFGSLGDAIEHVESVLILRCAPSRERSLALTKLEECAMWAEKSLALHGANRGDGGA